MSKKKILIVDDDAKFLQFLQTQLQQNGYEVAGLRDGTDLLKVMSIENPDLVMVDLLLPKIHGFELCSQIKKSVEYHMTPVILMTSLYKSPKYEFEGRGHGADAFIRKPFELKELLGTIGSFLPVEITPRPLHPDAQAVLNELRDKFAHELPGKIAFIEAGWARLRQQWDYSTTLELMENFHNLAGTGTTFGFPEVTRIARELEQTFLERVDHLEPPSPELKERITYQIGQLRQIARPGS